MSNSIIDTKIVRSSHYGVYTRWLRNGVANRACERQAKELFGEDISYESFRRYKESMSSDEIVLNKFPYAEFDLLIDEEKVLMQAMLILEQRIVNGQKLEEKMGVPLTHVDNMLNLLTRMCVQLSDMKYKRLRPNVRTIVNQQFNRFATNKPNNESDDEFRKRIAAIIERAASAENTKAAITNSDSEVDQWFDNIIQESKNNQEQTNNGANPTANVTA